MARNKGSGNSRKVERQVSLLLNLLLFEKQINILVLSFVSDLSDDEEQVKRQVKKKRRKTRSEDEDEEQEAIWKKKKQHRRKGKK